MKNTYHKTNLNDEDLVTGILEQAIIDLMVLVGHTISKEMKPGKMMTKELEADWQIMNRYKELYKFFHSNEFTDYMNENGSKLYDMTIIHVFEEAIAKIDDRERERQKRRNKQNGKN